MLQNILINEILPNPNGTDLGYEWIELYNNSEIEIDLQNFNIELGGSSFIKSLTINSPQKLKAKGYFLICEKLVVECNYYVDKIGMQNGVGASDGVRLLDNNSKVIDTVLYDEPNSNNLASDKNIIALDTELSQNPASDVSLGRISNIDTNLGSDFSIFTIPTPGKQNISMTNNYEISEYAPSQGYIELLTENSFKDPNILIKVNDNEIIINELTYPILLLHFQPIYSDSCAQIVKTDGTILQELCLKPYSNNYSICNIPPNNSNNYVACNFTPALANSRYIPNEFTDLFDIEQSFEVNSISFVEACIKTLDTNSKIKTIYDNTGGLKLSISENVPVDGCYQLEIKKLINEIMINKIFENSNITPTPLNLKNLNIIKPDWKYLETDCVKLYYNPNLFKSYVQCNGIDAEINSTLENISDTFHVKGFFVPYSTSSENLVKYRIYLPELSSISQDLQTNQILLSKTGQSEIFIITVVFSLLFLILLLSDKLGRLLKFKYIVYAKK